MLWKVATATIINNALPFIISHQAIVVHGSLAVDGRVKAELRTSPPEGGTPNLLEHLFNYTIAGFKSFAQFLWLAAAAFGHVGFAAALAADDRRELFDDLPGRNSLGEIV